MVFGNKIINPETKVMLKIENFELERVYENTFLGVKMDPNFNWKPQVKHVHSKISKGIGVMRKVKRFLNHKSMCTLYNSLILPHLSYCAEIWGNTYKTTLDPIEKIQKKAIRIVNDAGYLDHTTPLFIKCKALKFADIVQLKTAQIVFRARHNLLPENLQTLFQNRDGRYELRRAMNFKHPRARINVKEYSVSVCGVKLWNSLPESLQQSGTESQFKRKFKKMAIEKYKCEE